MNALADLSPTVLAGLSALVLVQLALQISALVSLVRTPAERITLGGRKWVWAIIILLGEIIGPIVYFAAGRQSAPAEEPVTAAPATQRAAHAADTLYGAAEATPAGATPAGATPTAATPAAATPTGAGLADADAADPAQGADGTGMGELP